MGDFRIIVDAVGGHGCQREVKDGGAVKDDCGQPSCPDCAARGFITKLKAQGCSVAAAKLYHWPQIMADGLLRERGGPIDDLLSGKRSGSF